MRWCLVLLLVISTPAALADEPATAVVNAEAAWQEFEETFTTYYGYVDRDDLDEEALMAAGRAAFVECDATPCFANVLHALLLAWTDPHLAVSPRPAAAGNVWPTVADLAIQWEAGQYRVADVRRDGPAAEAGVRPGDVLLGIDGTPVDELVRGLGAPFIATLTDPQRSYFATLAANGPRGDGERRLRIKGRGVVRLPNPGAFATSVSERIPVEVRREGRVAVLRLNNSLGDRATIEAIDAAFSAAADADGLVIDLRNTPSGGNSDVARALIGHVVGEMTAYQVHEIPATERRTTVRRRFVEYVLPRAPRFAGPVAVLGSRWTGSMGEGLVIGLQAAGARTFGSGLGDLLGAVHRFELPASGTSVVLGAEVLLHVDGRPREDFVPDVLVDPAECAADGSDPALTAALAWLSDELGD